VEKNVLPLMTLITLIDPDFVDQRHGAPHSSRFSMSGRIFDEWEDHGTAAWFREQEMPAQLRMGALDR
jgi:hypothetical protein